MAKYLVIVESPGKVSKIQHFLGQNYKVLASVGHCVDLDPKKISVDIKHNFEPTFNIIPGKKDIVKSIQEAAKKSQIVYIMSDDDKEGCALGRHIAELLPKNTAVKRAKAHAITQQEIVSAIKNATDMSVDDSMVESQITRRVLDRLVGWRTSYLTKTATGGSSAGRVQSIALRLLAEREKEIQSFVPQEYWEIVAELLSPKNEPFTVKLDASVKIKNEDEARNIYDLVKVGTPVVKDVISKVVQVSPVPPFTTQSLISAAKSAFGWSNSRTMKVAQEAYESGDISYHRTDSHVIAPEILAAVRSFISANLGQAYLPDKPNFYKNKASAQAAHTSICPTKIGVTQVSTGDHSKLYDLIWKRTVASQSVPSKEKRTKVIVDISHYDFSANGTTMLFDGWKKIYDYIHSEDVILPELNKGDVCKWEN